MIDLDAEKAIIAEITEEHAFHCFETVAEELVEAGIAKTGEADEVLESRGLRTVADEWLRIVTEEPKRCACDEQD